MKLINHINKTNDFYQGPPRFTCRFTIVPLFVDSQQYHLILYLSILNCTFKPSLMHNSTPPPRFTCRFTTVPFKPLFVDSQRYNLNLVSCTIVPLNQLFNSIQYSPLIIIINHLFMYTYINNNLCFRKPVYSSNKR